MRELTEQEMTFLYGDLPINSTTMMKAIPQDKLRELLDERAKSAALVEALEYMLAPNKEPDPSNYYDHIAREALRKYRGE